MALGYTQDMRVNNEWRGPSYDLQIQTQAVNQAKAKDLPVTVFV